MPWRPTSHRAVPRPTRNWREEDARRLADPALAQAKHLRSTARWQRVRLVQLREHPLCNDPYGLHTKGGRIEPATEVDHVIPLREAPTLAYEPSNLQSMCHDCHAIKSGRERQRYGSTAHTQASKG